MLLQGMVVAIVVQQGLAMPRFRLDYFGQENRMVASFDDGRYPAFESSQAVEEQGHAAGGAVPFHTVEAAFWLFGENYRELALGFRQNIYPENTLEKDRRSRCRPESTGARWRQP
jgi:hypothetical protein